MAAELRQAISKGRYASSLTDIDKGDYSKVWLGIEPHHIHTFENGKTYSDSSKDKRVLIQIGVYIDARELGAQLEHLLSLQHSEQYPLSLTELLNRTNSLNWPPHAPYTTRIRTPEADLRLLNIWTDRCISHHPSTCEKTATSTISTVRLIDVQEKRVVDAPGNVSWIALSYCWGGPQRHCLRKGNLKHYQQVGALTENVLPPVIVDAMTTTAALNERYLWVDSMCIVQDDEFDKTKFLSVMDTIYALAVVTIINAATADVNAQSGLPGIRNPSPRRTQEPFQINGAWLTETLDPAHGSFQGYLDKSIWSTRGWTFQEGLLSRRCLIFTPEQIFWQCQKSSWCEGTFWERDDELQIYRHYFANNLLASLLQPLGRGWAETYLAIMQKYLSRAFTSEADRLHALTGILRVLERSTGEEFFWGFPTTRLEHGLAFTPENPVIRRKDHHNFIDTQGQLVFCPFPSWSWVGWTGSSNMDSLRDSITTGTLGLRFFRLSEDGIPVRVDLPPSPTKKFDDGDIHQQTRYPLDAIHTWIDKDRQEVSTADVPSSIFVQNHLIQSLLCFWTSTATLRITQRGWNNYYNEPHVVLSSGDTEFAGLWGRSIKNFNFPDFGKFVVVGAEKLRMSRGRDLTLKLLLVETHPQNRFVIQRQHLVTNVRESDWEKLHDREWELIFLA
ncbi:hypothetical protein H2198_009098 [Neophaeococcomyces mojaviensis]|uniref:Uncharacterized protein n=1 Tax=Neophaeococcomyces mojaviensis TaxID=3383035 RepID=A0ACC2ZVG1_9EURO|nr:hypothetical protein H2198_009098 [Knufia sp. JES_112]